MRFCDRVTLPAVLAFWRGCFLGAVSVGVAAFFGGGASFFLATTIATTSACFIEWPPGKAKLQLD